MSKILINAQNTDLSGIGGKARNLARLEDMGMPVPAWTVIPERVLLEQIPEEVDASTMRAHYDQLSLPGEVLAELKAFFGTDHHKKSYAVRSSAVDEDGSQFSFAGQFETFLHVGFDEIEKNVFDFCVLIWYEYMDLKK